jgi:hypothetical protein
MSVKMATRRLMSGHFQSNDTSYFGGYAGSGAIYMSKAVLVELQKLVEQAATLATT